MKITSLRTDMDKESFAPILAITAEIPLQMMSEASYFTDDERALRIGREVIKALETWTAEKK